MSGEFPALSQMKPMLVGASGKQMKRKILRRAGLDINLAARLDIKTSLKAGLAMGALLFGAQAAIPQQAGRQQSGTQQTQYNQSAKQIDNDKTTSESVPAETTAEQAADAIAAYKVQQLIDMAERQYQSGVDNYRAGKLDAARSDFDAAVDMMLTSGLDIQSNSQLDDEFERVVDRVNTLEMEALKQGNGFSPREEAAPVEAGSNIPFTSDPGLNAKLKEQLQTTQSDMPLVVNEYVAGFINYFTNSEAGRAHLEHSLERAGKYKDMISRILREEGVPQDLIYQAVTESGFQPQAYNAKSGAGGMWQFMPFSSYGLERNGWFDERFDPEKSTRAYARYIKELYRQFDDWYLAMAAYDWGPGNIQKAVQRTGYADFWELYQRNVLPSETKNYVPGILAAIIMAKNPKQYGLEGVVPDPPQLSDTVTVDYGVDLRLVADVTGSSLQDIVALNPSLLRLTTPKDLSFDLHIPVGTLAEYQKRMAAIPEEKRESWRFHVVAANETLGGIAEEFHVRVKELAQANELDETDEITPGEELVVPVAVVTKAGLQTVTYKVRTGDTLVTVADRFGVTVADLKMWNHLTTSAVAPGRLLKVSEPVHLAPMGKVRRSRSAGSSKAGTAKSTTTSSTAVASKSKATRKKHKSTANQ